MMFRVVLMCSMVLMTCVASATVFESGDFQLEIDEKGQVTALIDKTNNTNYIAPDQPSPLLQVYKDDTFHLPVKAAWDDVKQQLTLHYPKVQLTVQVEERDAYVTLELIGATPLDTIDRVQWGPVATSIKRNVGEVIGMVRNETFAIGMLGLNPKSLGGPADTNTGRDISRGRSAMPTSWGSTLQAYSLDRSRPRTANVWGGHFKNMPIPSIPGETVIGSKVAFFGCAEPRALDRVGVIELAEGLPHPVYNGKWSRMNLDLGRSYLICEFSEETVDEVIAYTKRGNFLSLYHQHPFKSWGHYKLRADHFPNGEKGMKTCVDKAAAAGLLMGGHTLTNFINTNDPYVTPVPDKRLAKTGSSFLTGDISADTTEIEVASPEFFNNTKANWLRTVMIGEELVRYSTVSKTAPWKLLDCRRGAWKTRASAHKKGAEIGKLMDHPYNVFFPNYEMQHDVARHLAKLFNATGMNHFDFDGHEGCWASGQGDFALEMFAKVVYEHTNHFMHNGTSNSESFYWHINTCCNWGEPWYGGFRSSMAQYRINNQAMLERNFMPKMLGWFRLTSETTLSDIEWLMARSAGFNSGFAITTSLNALRKNPLTNTLLDTIREWENLRMTDAFTEAQRQTMRNTDNEFHLMKVSDSEFDIAMYQRSEIFEYKHYVRQPGEPKFAQWTVTQPGNRGPLNFTLEVKGEDGSIDKIVFEIDNYIRFEVPFVVKAGQTVVCDGTKTLRLYDAKGRQIKKHTFSEDSPAIPKGPHDIVFACDFEGEPTPVVQVRFKALGEVEHIALQSK